MRELGVGEAISRTLLYVLHPECSVRVCRVAPCGTLCYTETSLNITFVLNVCFCWLYQWGLRYSKFNFLFCIYVRYFYFLE
jgi:hypothetical protein